MGDKYCPAGIIECEHYKGGDCWCRSNNSILDLVGVEQCPWPSKQQKPIEELEWLSNIGDLKKGMTFTLVEKKPISSLAKRIELQFMLRGEHGEPIYPAYIPGYIKNILREVYQLARIHAVTEVSYQDGCKELGIE